MRILYVLFFLLTLNSCQKVKEKEVVRLMKEWNRKEVLFPDAIYCIGKRYIKGDS